MDEEEIMSQTKFQEALKIKGIELSEKQLKQFDLYRQLLQEYNQKINLTAIIETDEIYIKHFYDSLIPSFHIGVEGELLDVGAGAGFPSIPLKIVYPDLNVTILEPIQKRVRFLEVLCKDLDLDVRIINERAEDHIKDNDKRYDFVTARAVASLPILVELCLPFVEIDGNFIAMKGAKAEEELKDSYQAITKLGGKYVTTFFDELEGADRSTILIKKVKNTPHKYPRNYGQIKKNPL